MPEMLKFKLLRGSHQQSVPTGAGCPPCEGTGKTEGGRYCRPCKGLGKELRTTTHNSNDETDIVENYIDLEARFGSEKFQNLTRMVPTPGNAAILAELDALKAENEKLRTGGGDPVKESLDLRSKSDAELLDLAAKFNPPVDLFDVESRESIINAIEFALDSFGDTRGD